MFTFHIIIYSYVSFNGMFSVYLKFMSLRKNVDRITLTCEVNIKRKPIRPTENFPPGFIFGWTYNNILAMVHIRIYFNVKIMKPHQHCWIKSILMS